MHREGLCLFYLSIRAEVCLVLTRQTSKKLEKSEAEKSKVEKELNTAKIALGALKNELATLRETHRQRVAAYSSETIQLKEAVSELKGEIITVERRESVAVEELENKLNAQHEAEKGKIGVLQGTISALKSEKCALETQESQATVALRGEIRALTSAVLDLKGQLAVSKKCHAKDKAEIGALQGR